MFLFKNHAENEAGKLVPDLFLFCKKTLHEVKVWCLVSVYFDSPQLGKLHKTLDYWSRDKFHFDFLEKGLEKVFPPRLYDFSTKTWLMLYSINWLNFIVSISLLLEILGNMYIVIACFQVSDVLVMAL